MTDELEGQTVQRVHGGPTLLRCVVPDKSLLKLSSSGVSCQSVVERRLRKRTKPHSGELKQQPETLLGDSEATLSE